MAMERASLIAGDAVLPVSGQKHMIPVIEDKELTALVCYAD